MNMQSVPARYEEAIGRMLGRIDATAAAVGEAFPLSADPATGEWKTAPDGRWTGGFWAGQLWLAALASGEARYVSLAEAAMRRLEVRLPIDNVLNGLVFYYGAAIGALLKRSKPAAELARKGAQALAGRFTPVTGLIPLGHQSGSLTGDANGETNIDGVPGMTLLHWAADDLGDAKLREVATSHMLRHIELCQRLDGSLHQAAAVDPATGKTLKQYSPRGFEGKGTWARAQGWGLVGFVQAYAWTKDQRFLDASRKLADWWLAHAPADRVAFWDFTDPTQPDCERDTSGTAMIAGALLKLEKLGQGRRYGEAGEATVRALVENHLAPSGALTEGCWQRNEGMATCHELVWGDYYLLEALLMLDGRLHRIV